MTAGRIECPVYKFAALLAGHIVQGPALIIDTNSTIVVEPDCTAVVTEDGCVKITVGFID